MIRSHQGADHPRGHADGQRIARAVPRADRRPAQAFRRVELALHLKVPVRGLYGGQDASIPVAHVEEMRAALKAAGNTTSEIIVYPEAPHAFYADYRPNYRKEAAEDGWKKMQEWFRRYGVA